MADSEPVDTTQQVTSKTPTTTKHEKNPKRVAAGKAIAAKTKQARKAQQKALAEAQMILANNQLKQDAPVADPPPSDTPATLLTTTQWQSVTGILLTLLGFYFKREDIKGMLTTKKAPQDVDTTPPALPPSPVDVEPKRKGGIQPMD